MMTNEAVTTSFSPPAAPPARWLLGRLSEHRELQGQLVERPGLLVVEADPLSGTSGVVKHAVAELSYPSVYVDARGAGDAMDLAMLIADSTVKALQPKAAAWWLGDDVPFDVEGLRLSRALSVQGVPLEDLRDGGGQELARLREALQVVAALADANVLLAIDHLDSLLENVSARAAEELLAIIRAERQAPSSAELLLVGRPQGRLINALHNPSAALYHAGQSIRMRRAAPARIVDDLAIARAWTDLPVDVIRDAADLAEGAPAILWRILDLVRDASDEAAPVRAQWAWDRLEDAHAPMAAQQFELLGGAHRVAPAVVAAVSHGLGPYELPLNPKTVRDALSALRRRGIAWSPEKGRWRIADPLLGDWARTHSPSWVTRRARRRT
jgi:hypothetical protein